MTTNRQKLIAYLKNTAAARQIVSSYPANTNPATDDCEWEKEAALEQDGLEQDWWDDRWDWFTGCPWITDAVGAFAAGMLDFNS